MRADGALANRFLQQHQRLHIRFLSDAATARICYTSTDELINALHYRISHMPPELAQAPIEMTHLAPAFGHTDAE